MEWEKIICKQYNLIKEYLKYIKKLYNSIPKIQITQLKIGKGFE